MKIPIPVEAGAVVILPPVVADKDIVSLHADFPDAVGIRLRDADGLILQDCPGGADIVALVGIFQAYDGGGLREAVGLNQVDPL